MTLFLVLAAVVPAFLLMFWFWRSDRFPEPPSLVWITFGLGVLSVVPAVLLSVILMTVVPAGASPALEALRQAFLGAALPEDFAKFMVLFFVVSRCRDFDEPMDGLVYGAAASMGFAALENLLYVMNGGWNVAVLRAVTSLPTHCLHGAIMGYLIALFVFPPRPRQVHLLLALLIPIGLHGLYDFPLMLGDLHFIVVAVIAVEWIVVIRLMRHFRREQTRLLAEAG